MSEPITPAADDPQDALTSEFKGQTFRLNPDPSEYAFLEFAAAAAEGQDGNTLEGMASLLRFVLELVHEDDRDRFRRLARRERASTDDLLEFMGLKAEADAERPTERSSDSSDGPTSTPQKFGSDSEGRDYPTPGLALVRSRPDLAVFLDQAAKAG